ncbi:CBS domain-containing protein [Actinocorallia longicatena]|uniref:Hypoxic response protein Hrp1 n=1 Tax=Actinocorallia longicatena TaxID=111803 RepID=A0ABP6QAH1_9ACTN
MTTARDLMNPGAECIPAHETLDRAAEMMRELGVGALPVCGGNDRLEGIITDRDIVVKCVAAGKDPSKTTAADLATGLVWVDANATVEDALAKMEQHQIRRLPVLDDKRIVGMISEADLARSLPDAQLTSFVHAIYKA